MQSLIASSALSEIRSRRLPAEIQTDLNQGKPAQAGPNRYRSGLGLHLVVRDRAVVPLLRRGRGKGNKSKIRTRVKPASKRASISNSTPSDGHESGPSPTCAPRR